MPEKQTFDEAIHAIHSTLEEAEHQLSELGEGLQFLVGLDGDVEIVRRHRTGATERPKIVVARLRGCDPVLWRGDVPSWLRSVAPEHDAARSGSMPSEARGDSAKEPTGGEPTDATPSEES